MREQLKKYKTKVEQKLAGFFDKKIADTKGFNKEILKHLKEFTLRGKSKRIRAFLIFTGYEAFGGGNQKEIVKASMSIELIHSFFLIHDDIIDQDELRRGKPTFHKGFEKYKDKHFGESIAIIAGDIAHTLAIESFLSTNFSLGKKLKVLQKINQMILDSCEGENLDILLPVQKKQSSQKDILRVYEYKTAKYTFEAPLHIGALLAGATDKDLKALSDYSIPLGIAFQIQDDILGVFGDEREIGKPVGSDIREGKKTLLVWKALQSANQTQKKKLSQIFNQEKISKKEVNEIRQIMIDSGALGWTQDNAKKLGYGAQKQISSLSRINPKAKKVLLELIDYIINRTN
ncbi:polyprenyl synthetase family protein [Patescibacteria group bacterium]|nr:polyprenyl synthetase family protein [Patescibacteria group bacterium]